MRKTSIRKAFNIFLLIASYYLSKIFKRNIHWGNPMSLSFEPTTSCNLRCPECPSGLRSFTRPTGMLKSNTFTKLIDSVKKDLHYLILYFQGEPYLNKDLFSMARYAHENNIYVATSTNGHYLDPENAKKTVESGLDRLIISIDGTDQSTFEQYRVGGNLEKVLEGTRNVVRAKKAARSKTPYIIFQFLVVKPNEHQLDKVEKLASEIGVDEVAFKSAQIYDYENGSPLIPNNDKYSRYRKNKQGKYEIKSGMNNSCWKMWSSSVITWDGKLVPCCFDKDAQHTLGELNSNSFRSIWKGEKYNRFRAQLLKQRSNIEMCKNCTEGTKVWV